MTLLLSFSRTLNGDMHQVSALKKNELTFLSWWTAYQICQVAESHPSCILETQGRGSSGCSSQMIMTVTSHCKNRNGGHKTSCRRNLAILICALPADCCPTPNAILDWHRIYDGSAVSLDIGFILSLRGCLSCLQTAHSQKAKPNNPYINLCLSLWDS